MSGRLLEAVRGMFGARRRSELRTMTSQGVVRIIGGHVEWRIAPAEGDFWTGECDALNLTVSSETLYDLMEDIGLTMNTMFRDLYETNELERFLHEHGWRTREATS